MLGDITKAGGRWLTVLWRRMTVQEVIARRLANDSMKGITKAIELLIKLAW